MTVISRSRDDVTSAEHIFGDGPSEISLTAAKLIFSVYAESLRTSLSRRQPNPATMSQFRAKKLDLGCFLNIKIIRDHTKRKTFEQFEPQR